MGQIPAFCLPNAVWASASSGFRIVSDTLVCNTAIIDLPASSVDMYTYCCYTTWEKISRSKTVRQHTVPIRRSSYCNVKLQCSFMRTYGLRIALIFIAARCCASAAYAIMRCPSVCPSVCVSVTFVHSVKTNKDIFQKISPPGSDTILVSPYQRAWRYSDGNRLPLMGTSNAGGVGRNRDFEPISGFMRAVNRSSGKFNTLSCDGPWRVDNA